MNYNITKINYKIMSSGRTTSKMPATKKLCTYLARIGLAINAPVFDAYQRGLDYDVSEYIRMMKCEGKEIPTELEQFQLRIPFTFDPAIKDMAGSSLFVTFCHDLIALLQDNNVRIMIETILP